MEGAAAVKEKDKEDKPEVSLYKNIAKGTTDPGVDCFNQ